MKRFFLIQTTILALAAACDDDSATKRSVSFDVQSSFDGDHMLITLDGSEVMSQLVTTNQILGVDLNARKTLLVKPGKHHLQVIVNDDKQLTTTIRVDSDLYLGIRFDSQTQQVSITEARQPFMYD